MGRCTGARRETAAYPGPTRTARGWMRVPRRVLAAILVAVGLSGCSGGSKPAAESKPSSGAPTLSADGGGLQQELISVVNQVRPEVVEITTNSGLGSGVAYDDRGDVVTNAHVVAGATRLQVSLYTGQALPATLVGVYPPDDLAVVRVAGAKLSPASLADSDKLSVGEICLAIGNPLGLASSVTEGIVSFNGRTVSEGAGIVLPDTVQTSAAINPGNSGGALVDLAGRLIGSPTLAAADPKLGGGAAPGIGFAIPSNRVRFIADQLIAHGKVTNTGRASLGVTATTGYSAEGRPIGVVVVGVATGGPAAKAGLNPGDLIVAMGTESTPNLAAMQSVLAGLAAGSTVQVSVVTPGEARRSVSVTLQELPA